MRLIACLLILSLCGCSAAQLRQEFIGYSKNDVKDSKNKQAQSFNMNASDCFAKIKDALKTMKATAREDARDYYIAADNFQLAFRSAVDTTPVGILVTSKGADKCDVEVASGNAALAVFVSNEISKALNPRPKEETVK